MEQNMVIAAGILGFSAVACAIVLVMGRIKVEQQKTLRLLLERGDSAGDILNTLYSPGALSADTRRGILFIALGLAWSLTTVFVGGMGWIFGGLPVAAGLIFLLFGKLNARR